MTIKYPPTIARFLQDCITWAEHVERAPETGDSMRSYAGQMKLIGADVLQRHLGEEARNNAARTLKRRGSR